MEIEQLAHEMIVRSMQISDGVEAVPSVEQQSMLVRRLHLDVQADPGEDDDGFAETLGRSIGAARQRLGISKAEFADKVGMSRAAAYALENGEVWPRRETLSRISQVLGISMLRVFDPVYLMLDSELRRVSDAVSFTLFRLAATRLGISDRVVQDAVRNMQNEASSMDETEPDGVSEGSLDTACDEPLLSANRLAQVDKADS